MIQIGEIRDRETMTAAIAYAQSGHLCVATLHANNSYRALNRILSFYPVEVRPTLLGDLGGALRAIVAQRLLRTPSGGRVPALEVHAEHRAGGRADRQGRLLRASRKRWKSRWPKARRPSRKTSPASSPKSRVTREEGLSQADSPTNLMWRLQNRKAPPSAQIEERTCLDQVEEPTFTDITLDVTSLSQRLFPMSRTLQLAEQLISRPSVTPDDAGCQQILGERLARLGFTLETIESGPADFRVTNLWAVRRPASAVATKTHRVRRPHRRGAHRPASSNGPATPSRPRTATASSTAAAPAT